ncbi:hypothetical protein [Desulfovibrio sp. UCD-KL4C]|uniref:hypothetical protein n=1 Tax=Desulfovibrio sp. UCD-KL4C TaxID=2578120 RepID=UPI0025BC014B|nr:hypothetical protein [Desulfovibrio sp. UCD-KL4C]
MTNRTYDTPEIQDLKKKLVKALDEVGAGYCLVFYEKNGSDMDYKTVPVHPIVITMAKRMTDTFVLKAVDEMDENHDPRDIESELPAECAEFKIKLEGYIRVFKEAGYSDENAFRLALDRLGVKHCMWDPEVYPIED